MRRRLEARCLSEEGRAQFGIPPDVVPPSHLVLEEPCQQQTLSSGRLNQHAVVLLRAAQHESIEHRAEVGRSRQILGGARETCA